MYKDGRGRWETLWLFTIGLVLYPFNSGGQRAFRERAFRRRYMDSRDPDRFSEGLHVLERYCISEDRTDPDFENRQLHRDIIGRTANDDAESIEWRSFWFRAPIRKLLQAMLNQAVANGFDEVEIAAPVNNTVWIRYRGESEELEAMSIPLNLNGALLRETRQAASFEPGVYFYHTYKPDAQVKVQSIAVATGDDGVTRIKIHLPPHFQMPPIRLRGPIFPVTPDAQFNTEIRKALEKVGNRIPAN